MKKFVYFILVLLLLITAEYFFLTEIFSQKRVPVIAVSLVTILACLFVFTRFFKKSVFTS